MESIREKNGSQGESYRHFRGFLFLSFVLYGLEGWRRRYGDSFVIDELFLDG
jgi:hypothetical protein